MKTCITALITLLATATLSCAGELEDANAAIQEALEAKTAADQQEDGTHDAYIIYLVFGGQPLPEVNVHTTAGNQAMANAADHYYDGVAEYNVGNYAESIPHFEASTYDADAGYGHFFQAYLIIIVAGGMLP